MMKVTKRKTLKPGMKIRREMKKLTVKMTFSSPMAM
jgi:hypothetical protein